jgi:hypothetical protein
MGAPEHVVGLEPLLGRRVSPWLFRIAVGLALGGCGEKFSPAAGGGDPDGGTGATTGSGGSTSGGSSGTNGANGSSGGGSGGTNGASGSGGGTSDSGPPDSNPGDVRTDLPVTPPVPVDGLILWLKADAGITRDVDSVTEWADQSSAGNHATQPALSLRPRLVASGIADGPSVDFDGTNDFLMLPNGFGDFTAGVSIFVVTLQHSSDRCSALIQLSNGSEIDDVTLGQFMGLTLYEVADEYFSGEAFPVGSAQLLAVVHAPDRAFVIRRNGRPSTNGTASLPIAIERKQNVVGNSLYDDCGTYAGQISEVLLYSRAVSNDELFAIERYLRDRSGIR